MKKAFFLLPLLGVLNALPARADVAWEHRGSVKIGAAPVLSFSLRNEWSGQKHRAVFGYDASKVMGAMGAPAGTQGTRGEVTMIERLDSDRLVLSSNLAKNYIDEPYGSLKSRLRLNFWEALGANLNATDVPELTPAQRQRLGQEIRAVVTPLTRKVSRTYFRALPNARVINGLSSRGYRFTSMANIAPDKAAGEWVTLRAEWWLAEGQTGDEEIRAFTQSANALKAQGGGPTASMWINEYSPVLWEAAPEEAHQALASLIGAPDATNAGFRGTPVQFFVTIAPPPAMQMSMGGAVRVSLELARRDTSGVNTALFEAPTGYSRIEIEPFIGMAQNFIRIGRGQLEELLK
jgi:hypothetical protein